MPLNIQAGAGGVPVGDQIVDAFGQATTDASTQVETAIANASGNPGDPSNMIAMQVALTNYSLALQVQSSVIKSMEDTAKSITQKL